MKMFKDVAYKTNRAIEAPSSSFIIPCPKYNMSFSLATKIMIAVVQVRIDMFLIFSFKLFGFSKYKMTNVDKA